MGHASQEALRVKTNREIARKKALIEREQPERVIGIVGKCPILANLNRARSTQNSRHEEYGPKEDSKPQYNQSKPMNLGDYSQLKAPTVLKVTLEKINEDRDIHIESSKSERKDDLEGSEKKTVTIGVHTHHLSAITLDRSKLDIKDSKDNSLGQGQSMHGNSPLSHHRKS